MRLTDDDRRAWARYERAGRRAAADYYQRLATTSFDTDRAARDAHAAYNHGDRTPDVIEGER